MGIKTSFDFIMVRRIKDEQEKDGGRGGNMPSIGARVKGEGKDSAYTQT